MRKLLQRLLVVSIFAASISVGSAATSYTSAAVTPLGQQGCEQGQVVGTRNLVQDGNFAAAYTGVISFTTDLVQRDPGIYPNDPPGGFSIQRGPVSYESNTLIGRPFAGDPSREAPPSETYFYSNPFVNRNGTNFYTGGAGLLWRQTVPVSRTTTYNFYAYFDNLIVPGSTANDPVIELRVGDPADPSPSIAAGPAITVTKEPDSWVPIQYAFITGPTQTEATLEIWAVTGRDPNVNPFFGDDFAMVGINLRQCASAVGIAKNAAPPVRNSDGSYDITYTLNLRNYGSSPDPVTDLQVVDDLTRTFANAASFTVRSISSSNNLTVNSAFTGISPNDRLLAPGNLLPSGPTGVATITFTVRITPGPGVGGRGPFLNTAIVSATSGGATVEDDSVPGTTPDLGRDDNPKDPEDDKPTDVSIGTKVALPLIARP